MRHLTSIADVSSWFTFGLPLTFCQRLQSFLWHVMWTDVVKDIQDFWLPIFPRTHIFQPQVLGYWNILSLPDIHHFESVHAWTSLQIQNPKSLPNWEWIITFSTPISTNLELNVVIMYNILPVYKLTTIEKLTQIYFECRKNTPNITSQ
jgi:hypothetical protein